MSRLKRYEALNRARFFKRKALKSRPQSGSMLSMTVLCVGIVLATCVISFGFYMVLTEQKRGQGQTDRVAMDVAKTMNANDRIGDINSLIARNRELVYTSRTTFTNCDNSFLAFADPLAGQLLSEAITSNVTIDKERRNQITQIKKNVNNIIDQYNLKTSTGTVLQLPWWQSYEMNVTQVSAGSIKDVQSNVLHTEIYDDLNDLDKRANYFQPGSMLYTGNINAKLPNPDNSIDFKISSLPAAVERNLAPPRLTNPEAFKFANQIFDDGKFVNQSFDQIPSAVQVVGQMALAMNKDRQTMQIGSVALTNGAEPPLERAVGVNPHG